MLIWLIWLVRSLNLEGELHPTHPANIQTLQRLPSQINNLLQTKQQYTSTFLVYPLTSSLSHFHLIPSLKSLSTMSSHHKTTRPHAKHPTYGHLPLSTSGPQECALTGSALMNNPYFNKGVAFPSEERQNFKASVLFPFFFWLLRPGDIDGVVRDGD